MIGALSNEPVAKNAEVEFRFPANRANVKISCYAKSNFPAAAGVGTMAGYRREPHHLKTPGLIGTGDTIVVSLGIEYAGMCYQLVKNTLLPF